MKKIWAIVLIVLMTLSLLYPCVNANDRGVVVDKQNVTISITNTGLQVNEEIKVTNKGNENVSSLRFWVQQNILNAVKIIDTQSSKELVPIITGNIRDCNLSMVNLSIIPNGSMTLQMTYYLPINTQNYIKTILYNTTILSITYEDRNLFQGEHILYNSGENNAIQIRLYTPTEAPLNITMILIILVVAIIILAILLLLLKKQRSKAKKSIAESEETLTTKKTLLLSLLKDLEKQYRGHSISDETYTKLKDEFKQHAVDVMKKLDDLKK